MSNELIILTGVDETRVNATESARNTRNELLAAASLGKIVSSPESAQRAIKVLNEIKTFTSQIESARVRVKTPVLELGRKIDALARELTESVDAEANRISRLLGDYQAQQKRIAEEARQRAWEEEQRIRREAEEKARIEAERLRQEQQALHDKASRARSEERREVLRIQAEEAAKAAATASAAHVQATEQKIVEARVSAAALIPQKTAGIATREEMCFEITNIAALYEAAPYLVRLEPNTAAIKAALKGLEKGQALPGVKHWKENKAIVR